MEALVLIRQLARLTTAASLGLLQLAHFLILHSPIHHFVRRFLTLRTRSCSPPRLCRFCFPPLYSPEAIPDQNLPIRHAQPGLIDYLFDRMTIQICLPCYFSDLWSPSIVRNSQNCISLT